MAYSLSLLCSSNCIISTYLYSNSLTLLSSALLLFSPSRYFLNSRYFIFLILGFPPGSFPISLFSVYWDPLPRFLWACFPIKHDYNSYLESLSDNYKNWASIPLITFLMRMFHFFEFIQVLPSFWIISRDKC